MRKKQFLALLLAGALAAGMAPASILAQEADAAAIDVTVPESESADEAQTAEPAAEPEQAAASDPEQTGAPAEEPAAEEPSQEQPSDPAQTEQTAEPAAAQEEPSQELVVEEFTEDGLADADASETEDTSAASGVYIQNSDGTQTPYHSLEEAMAAVMATPEVTDPVSLGTTPIQIIVSGTVEVTQPITLSGRRCVSIAAGQAGTVIRRSGFTGNMFSVTGGAVFQFGEGKNADTGESYDLTVNGSLGDLTDSQGSIVYVGQGSCFGLNNGVTLTGSYTSTSGSAIYNDCGTVGLSGGTVAGNRSVDTVNGGGAIYSYGIAPADGSASDSGKVLISGTVNFYENTNDGINERTIVLNGSNACIVAAGTIGEGTSIDFTANDAAGRTSPVIRIGTDGNNTPYYSSMAEVLNYIHYADADYTVNEDGTLQSAKPDEPTPTPSPAPTAAPVSTMKLKSTALAWDKLDRNAATTTFYSDENGTYYAVWVARGSKAPTYEEAKADPDYTGALIANEKIKLALTGLDPDHDIDIYIYADDANGQKSSNTLFLQLPSAERPAKPEATPTPDPSATPTPTTRAPYTPAVTESTVTGLEQPLAFYPGQTYPFSVTGAGTDNEDPVQGDVQWRPLYWSSYSRPTSGQRQSIGTIGHKSGIKRAATFDMYIFFQKYVYDGTQWQPTDVVESMNYKFSSQAIEFTVTPTATPSITSAGGYYYGGGGTDTGDDDDGYSAYDHENDGDSTGTTSSSSNADTADNSPIASLMMLACLSLVAGGYVLVRRRKKVTE